MVDTITPNNKSHSDRPHNLDGGQLISIEEARTVIKISEAQRYYNDKRLFAIQKSTRVRFHPLQKLNEFLRLKFRWYYNWRLDPRYLYGDIDDQMFAIQRSTRTNITRLQPLHNKLRQISPWYYNWHIRPISHKVHWITLGLYLITIVAGIYFITAPPYKPIIAKKLPIEKDYSTIYPSVKKGAKEITAKRTLNQKVFDNGDGTQQYIISSGLIHYKDANGAFQDIDTKIQPTTGEADFEMTKSIYKVKFKSKFDANKLVHVEKDGEGFITTFGNLFWANKAQVEQIISAPQSVEGQSTDNKLTFSNAYGRGLDLSYEISDAKLSKKLNIPSLESLPSPNQTIAQGEEPSLALNAEFELNRDMDILIDGELWNRRTISTQAKNIEFQKDGKTVWGFSPPKAWDSQGEEKGINGTLTLTGTGKKLNLTVSFPYSWLKTAQYPVTIDPDTYYGATTDGYIRGFDGTYSTARSTAESYYTTAETQNLGQDFDGDFFTIYRNYFEFDTSAIPDEDNITQANLYLKAQNDFSMNDFDVRIHKYNWSSPIGDLNYEANYDGALASTYDNLWRNTADISVGTYYASSNLSTDWVDKTGYTQYALLSSRDVSNIEATDQEGIALYTQDASTQTNRPYLSITVAAGPATRYWINNTNGNWNDTANWSATSGGAGGESVPVAGDTAIFDNAGGTHNGALTINTAVNVATLTFDTNYTGTITQGANTITATTTMSLTGQSLTAGAAITASGTLTIATGKTLDMAGNNLTVTSTFSNSGTLKLTGGETTVSLTNDTDSGTVEYYGTSGPYTIKNLTYWDLKINGAATTFNQPAAANTVNGAFDVTAGVYSQGANQNLTVKGNFTIAGSGATFTKGTGTAKVILNGNLTFTGPATAQNLGVVDIGTSPDIIDLASDFAADTLTVNAGDTFNTNGYEVDIGSGGITLATGAPGGTLDTTDDVETDGTIITDAGNFTINSGAVFTKDVTGTRSLVKMDAGGAQNLTSASQDLGDFQTSTASTNVSLQDNLTTAVITVDASTTLNTTASNRSIGATNVTINGTLTANGSTITASGNWDKAATGTFNYGTSKVVFNGTGTIQNVSATSVTFYDLEAAAASKTTTLNNTVYVTHVLTLGTGIINSSATAAYAFYLYPTPSLTTYVNNGVTYGMSPNRVIFIFRTSSTSSASRDIIPGGNYPDIQIYSNASSTTSYAKMTGAITCFLFRVIPGHAGSVVDLTTQNYDITTSFTGLYSFIVGVEWSTVDRTGKIDLGTSTLTTAGDVTIADSTTGLNEINANGATLNIAGNFANSDKFTAGTSTVNFTKSSGTQTLNSGGTGTGYLFNNLTHSGAGTLSVVTNALDIDGLLTLSGGDFAPAAGINVTVAGGLTISGDSTTFTRSSGTLTFDGTGAWTDSRTTKASLGVVSINGTSATVTLGSSVKANTITIDTDDALSLGSSGYTLELAGDGASATVLTVSGTLTPGTSTVKYTATNSGGNVSVTTTTYNSLQLSGAETYDLTGNLTTPNNLTGNLTIDTGAILDATSLNNYNLTAVNVTINGTYTARGSTITASGNWNSSAGTFTYGTSTVDLTGTGNLQAPNTYQERFYNLNVAASGKTTTKYIASGGCSFGIANILTIGPGILTENTWGPVYLHKSTGDPLSINASATVNVSFDFFGSSQNIPGHTYGKRITVGGTATTVTQTGDVVINENLYVNGDTSATRVDTYNTGNYSLTVLGEVQVGYNQSTPDSNKSLNLGSSQVSVAGNFYMLGNLDAGTSTVTFNGNASANQTVTTGGQAFYNLIINNDEATYDDIIISSGALDINGKLTITDGDLQPGGNSTTIAGGLQFDETGGVYGTLTRSAGGLTFDGTGNWTDNRTTKASLGTIVVGGSSATLTLWSSVKADVITINATDILNLASSGYTLELAGTGSAQTVLTVSGTLTPGTSTVKYTATNSAANVNITTTTYNSLQLSGAETYDMTGNLTTPNALTGDLTVDNGATFSPGTYNLALSGITTNAGNFGSGTVSGAHTLNKGLINQATGNYKATSGTTTITASGFLGVFTDSGTFNHNNGKFNFNNNLSGITVTPSASTVFYDVDISGIAGPPTVVSLSTNPLVVANNLTINANGKLTTNSIAISVGGNWTNSGTFTANSGTVTFNGTATGKTINPGASSFYNLTFNGSGGAWSPLTNTVTVTNDLTMTAGTFDTSNGTANVTVNGTVAGTAGIINMTSTNTFTQNVAAAENFGTTSGSTAWTFYNLTFSSSSGTPTITTQTGGSGSITVAQTLTISANTTLNAGNRTWILSGAIASPFSYSGTLTPATSTFQYKNVNAGGTVNVTTAPYNNLQFTPASAETYDLTGNLTVGNALTGSLTINTNATLNTTATNYNITLAGNWDSSAGTFTYGTSTVTMTGTSKTLATPNRLWWDANNIFYNLTIDTGASVTTSNTSGNGFNISNVLTVNGTLTIPSNLNVGVSGTSSSTVSIGNSNTLTGAGTFNIVVYQNQQAITNNGTISVGTFYYHLSGTTTNPIIAATTYQSTVRIRCTGAQTNTAILQAGTFQVTGTLYLQATNDNGKAILDNTTNNTTITLGGLVIGESGQATRLAELKAGSGAVNVSGNWTNYQTFTAGSSTVTFNGTVQQTVTTGGTGAGKLFNTLTLNNTGTDGTANDDIVISNDLDVDSTFYITNGQLRLDTNNPNVNVAGDVSIASAGSVTKGTGTWTFDGTTATTYTDSTVTPQNIGAVTLNKTDTVAPGTNNKLSLASSMTVDTMTVDGTVGSFDTLYLGGSGYTLTLANAGATANVLTIQTNGLIDPGISTVKYTATNSAANINVTVVTAGPTYYSLEFAPSAAETYDLTGNLTSTNALTGNLTINPNATLDVTANNYNISLAGTWSHYGTFTARSGTVTFTGNATDDQNIITGAQAFYHLTLNNTQGTFDDAIIVGNLDVDGTLTITDGNLNLLSNNPNVNTAGNVSIGVSGSVTKGTGTWTFDGTTATTYEDLASTKNNIGAVAITKTDATPANNKVTLNTASGNYMKVDTLTISANNTLDLASGGYTLEIANAGATATVLTVSGTLTPGTSTVKYTATNSAANVNVTTTTYNSLQLSGAETYDMTGNLTTPNALTGDLTVDNGATFSPGTYNLALSGITTNAGNFGSGTVSGAHTLNKGLINQATGNYKATSGTTTITASGFLGVFTDSGTFNHNNGKFNFNNNLSGITVTPSASTVFYDVDISGIAGPPTVVSLSTNPFVVANNLTINGNGKLTTNNIAVSVAGNWANSGTFTAGSGTVTFNGTSTATISGPTTFNNLIMDTNADGAKQINFPTTTDNKQIINGTWTLDGASGKVLTLRSSTPDTAWYFQIASPFTSGDYINVQDSWSADANKITTGDYTTVINSGNNDGWIWDVHLSFSLDSNIITFNNLNSLNGWTDTKTTVVTTTTNAVNGYVVQASITQPLTSLAYPSRTISNFYGTWATPQLWPAGTYGFGYTSYDTLVQGSNRFATGTKYAGFSQTPPGDIVADNTGPVTDEQFTIQYKVAVSGTQAASAYGTTITYIVTANY